MRRLFLFGLLVSGISFMPNASFSQGKKGFGPGGFDPDADFSKLSGGKDVIVISELDQRSQFMIKKMADMNGFGDRITREQFKAAAEKAMAQFQKDGGFGKMGGPGGPPGGNGPGSSAFPIGDNPPKDRGKDRRRDPDAMAEEIFKRADRNNDGLLSFEEMSETLQRERDTYDTNKDGFIDLAEFKVYLAARLNRKDNSRSPDPAKAVEKRPEENSIPTPETQPYKEEARPPIFRAGKLPKELPEWFARLDREGDNDGQVGLYEWKTLGKGVDEFMAMDLNGDGLLTVEEYFRWKSSAAGKKAEGDRVAASAGSRSEDRLPNRSTLPNGDGSGRPRFDGGYGPPGGGDFGGPKGGDLRKNGTNGNGPPPK